MKMMMGTYYHSRLLSSFFQKQVKERVLDIGGRDGFFLHTYPAKENWVLDLLPQRTYPKIKYINGDATKMSIEDNFFNQVFSFCTLEHIENPSQFLNEAIRVTSPGGKIIILVPHPHMTIGPPFLTTWAKKNLWHHTLSQDLSVSGFKKLLAPYNSQISWRSFNIRNYFYRLFYLPTWYIWHLSETIGRFLVDQIIRLDKKLLYGGNGTLLIIITKESHGNIELDKNS